MPPPLALYSFFFFSRCVISAPSHLPSTARSFLGGKNRGLFLSSLRLFADLSSTRSFSPLLSARGRFFFFQARPRVGLIELPRFFFLLSILLFLREFPPFARSSSPPKELNLRSHLLLLLPLIMEDALLLSVKTRPPPETFFIDAQPLFSRSMDDERIWYMALPSPTSKESYPSLFLPNAWLSLVTRF